MVKLGLQGDFVGGVSFSLEPLGIYKFRVFGGFHKTGSSRVPRVSLGIHMLRVRV